MITEIESDIKIVDSGLDGSLSERFWKEDRSAMAIAAGDRSRTQTEFTQTSNARSLVPKLELTGAEVSVERLGQPRIAAGEQSWRPSWWPWQPKEPAKEQPVQQPAQQKQQQQEQSYGGIGIGLLEDPQSWGKLKVAPYEVSTLKEGGPAAKAGLQNGDLIVKIDGKDVRSMDYQQLTGLIRGAPGTSLSITVEREGAEIAMPVTREKITIEAPKEVQQRGMTFGELIQAMAGQLSGTAMLDTTAGNIRTGSCSPNPLYLGIINAAAKYMYDAPALGDLDSMRHRFNCEIKNNSDAVTFAAKALSLTNDKYNRVFEVGPAAPLPVTKRGAIGAMVGRGKSEDGSDSRPAETGPVKVTEIAPDSPAEKAGLKRGDEIIAVNGADIRRLPIEDVIMLVRGEPGTTVELKVARKGVEKIISITWGEPKPTDDVVEKSLGDGISYVRLRGFEDEKTLDAMRAALNKHIDARAYILDLRNNPGGDLHVALNFMSMFMRNGKMMRMYARTPSNPANPDYTEQEYSLDSKGMLIVSQGGGTGAPQSEERPREPYLIAGKPLIVLVNEHSASASEVVTGAFKDNKIATIVGEKTWGKGIGQAVMQLGPSVVLSVTNLRYTSPNGYWSGDAQGDRRGIVPDVVVTNPEDATIGGEGDLQLEKAIALLKRK